MSYDIYANSICHKTQRAAKAMLQADVSGGDVTTVTADQIFGGIEAGSVTAKRVVCVSRKADSEEIFDGNWDAELEIQCICPAADITEDDFHEFCGQIYSRFFQAPADVATALSNAAIQYTAQFVSPKSQDWDLEDDTWRGRLVLSVKCCGSVIA